MDVAAQIYSLLQDNWTETNPDVNNITWKEMEFDPKNPVIQVLIENFPLTSKWIDRGIYKVTHRVKISIFLKLIRYEDSSIIEGYRIKWFNIKEEINNILEKNKYNLENIINLDLTGGWDDRDSIALGRGIKTVKEPIIWQSEQVITVVYYTVETLETE